MKTPSKKKTTKPPHPGSHVKQVMDSLGLSINAFARKLDVAPATIHRIVTGKSAISPEMAIRLSATVGHTAQYWLQFQTDYDLYHASKRVDTSELKLLTKTALAEKARKRLTWTQSKNPAQILHHLSESGSRKWDRFSVFTVFRQCGWIYRHQS